MRTAAKVDNNQKEIITAFRKFGCSVLPLHTVGQGCPDILVSKSVRQTVLVEIKDGAKPPSARALTKDQEKFHAAWRGRICIVKDLGDVISTVKLLEAD
jgi:hypothetical protein